MRKDHELQALACFVHGVLASFHLLGIVYNLRRRNKGDVLIHTSVFVYDVHSAYKHYQAIKEAV